MPQLSWVDFVAAVQMGELVSFPTDTVPALACRPDRAERIYAAKQRSETKPLILMGGEVIDLWAYVQGSAAELAVWQQVADRYFPGALTLVLPASAQLPTAMNPADPTTIGIRVPNHPIARQILRCTQPLATTSVNRSGQPALTDWDKITAEFPEVYTLSPEAFAELQQDFSIDPLNLAFGSGQPSTVAKWQGSGWEILRQGEIVLEL
ncbi:MAG: L-threonylcarbamoyladenylate synthase [Elainella sp. Prado103]|jgi:L-threonylcarbamoyladenylate synthase|nr:L-threonylcarbamoyladenylate synthase [Elainella sp. Prado103]